MKKTFFSLLILLITNSCSEMSIIDDDTKAPGPPPVLVGPKLFYKMDGNCMDNSGNNLNAINVNASLTSDRYGIPNRAYSLNGINQFIDFPNIQSNLPITVSYWFKRRSLDKLKTVFLFQILIRIGIMVFLEE